MKISNRTHPVLSILGREKAPSRVASHSQRKDGNSEEDNKRLLQQLDANWNWLRDLAKKNVIVLTEPFMEAIQKSAHKLSDPELLREIGDYEGCICTKDTAILLRLKSEFDKDHVWRSRVDYIRLYGDVVLDVSFEESGYQYVSDYLRMEDEEFESVEDAIGVTTHFLHLLLLFIRFAEVETKFLPAGKRVKDFNCKYVNESAVNLTVYDSRWFTTLVKSDAFRVRGHFRLQPKKKDGQWTKELIWISDFEKSGYTAPARKLTA